MPVDCLSVCVPVVVWLSSCILDQLDNTLNSGPLILSGVSAAPGGILEMVYLRLFHWQQGLYLGEAKRESDLFL